MEINSACLTEQEVKNCVHTFMLWKSKMLGFPALYDSNVKNWINSNDNIVHLRRFIDNLLSDNLLVWPGGDASLCPYCVKYYDGTPQSCLDCEWGHQHIPCNQPDSWYRWACKKLEQEGASDFRDFFNKKGIDVKKALKKIVKNGGTHEDLVEKISLITLRP